MRRFSMLLSLLLPFGIARAQLSEVQPGVKVRLSAAGVLGAQLQGTVVRRSADSIAVLSGSGAIVTLPVHAITAGEISQGKSRVDGAKVGALWGVGIGLASGAIVATTNECKNSSNAKCENHGWDVVPAAAIGGALWGVAIGAVIGKERWAKLEIPASVTVGSTGKDLRLSVRLVY